MRDSGDGPEAVRDTGRTVRIELPPDDELGAALAALQAVGQHRLSPGSVVAAGGMSVVRAVEDPLLQRRQAQKSLKPESASDPGLQAVLLREARLMGALEHPSIVPVHAVALDAQGQLCFTMMLVQGSSLAERLRAAPAGLLRDRDRLLDLVDVLVCDALAYAHARGVVHCDVKASNVMLGEHGEVYLMDWGVARVLADRGSTLPPALRRPPPEASATVTSISGSPAYASPEQARAESWRIGPRTDVFLVGAMLYEILAGRPVNHASSPVDALARAARGDVRPPAEVAPDAGIPVELERIAMKALAFEPDDRYPDVSALRDDLVRFARGGQELPRRRYAAGEVIVRQGEPGEAAYVIVSGRCEVTVAEGGGESVRRVMGPGEPFGETALLSPGPRTATVTAVEPTVVEVIDGTRFEQTVTAMPAWMRRFVLVLADRFRERETDTAGRCAPGGRQPR